MLLELTFLRCFIDELETNAGYLSHSPFNPLNTNGVFGATGTAWFVLSENVDLFPNQL